MDGVEAEQNIVMLYMPDQCKCEDAGKRRRRRQRHTFNSSIRTAMGYSSSLEFGASAMAIGLGHTLDGWRAGEVKAGGLEGWRAGGLEGAGGLVVGWWRTCVGDGTWW